MYGRPILPDAEHCAYCGAFGDTWDHVIALAPQGIERDSSKAWRGQWLVPACKLCNNLLHSKLFSNIPEKAQFLSQAYERKFKKILLAPRWTEKEITELQGSLKRKVVEWEHTRAEINLRIAVLRLVAVQDVDYKRPANFGGDD